MSNLTSIARAECDECRNTGFKGRQGLYEILTITESLSEMIEPEITAMALRRQALADGMLPLRRAGALKVALAKTSLEEVLSVTPADNVAGKITSAGALPMQ